MRWLKRRYLVTDRRVLYVEGVLRRNSRDAGLKMITDVGFRQTFLGRRLGFGDLTIATAANRPLDFRQMRDAIAFKKVIMAAQQGTLEARASEIMGTSERVPSVAAVATAIDPASFPPPTPAWDGSDVPQIAEDDLPPADPEILARWRPRPPPGRRAAAPRSSGSPEVEAAAAGGGSRSTGGRSRRAGRRGRRAEAAVAGGRRDARRCRGRAGGRGRQLRRRPAEASAAALADIDSVIAAPDAEAATGAAAVTEALARWRTCVTPGAITDADYEAKKQELLDRL